LQLAVVPVEFIIMFNVRVYGLWIRDKRILVCEEYIGEMKVLKFPGGGLEFGEGTTDCLRREFKEELGIDIDNISHFYTTDFFVRSAMRESDQVISIYYLVKYDHDADLSAFSNNEIKFFWKDLKELDEDDVSLPIDKVVVSKLKNRDRQ